MISIDPWGPYTSNLSVPHEEPGWPMTTVDTAPVADTTQTDSPAWENDSILLMMSCDNRPWIFVLITFSIWNRWQIAEKPEHLSSYLPEVYRHNLNVEVLSHSLNKITAFKITSYRNRIIASLIKYVTGTSSNTVQSKEIDSPHHCNILHDLKKKDFDE